MSRLRWAKWAVVALLATGTTISWDAFPRPVDVLAEWAHFRPRFEPCDRDQDGVIDDEPCLVEYEELANGLERAYWPESQLTLPHDAIGPQEILYYDLRSTWPGCP